jgi:lantibiotic leader peptide-processing serine protease
VVALAACEYDTRLSPGPAAARGPALAVMAAQRTGGAATGRHIVSFRGRMPSDFAAQVQAKGGTVLWMSPRSGLAAVRGLSGPAAASLVGKQGVEAVDADETISLEMPKLGAVDAGDVSGVRSADNPAGAVRYARQWNMLAVQADAAWAKGFLGSPSVSIFMLDSGIDYLHADLEGRVDLTRSRDLLGTFKTDVVVDNDTVTVDFTEADTVMTYFPGRQVFTDLFFHGTHTAATVTSNAVRLAGITSKTTLVAVKVCGYINECPFSSILGGVIYAADNGADVMNLSLGGSFPKRGNRALIRLINRVFAYARSQGVTTVVSAGNEATDLDHNGNTYASFCDTPGVICVSATGPTSDATGTPATLTSPPNPNPFSGPWTSVDAPAYYTNFGRRAIDLAAPGGNSSLGPDLPFPASRDAFVWAACSQTSLLIDCSALPIFIIGAQGTSMAAPHVAGTAALLVPLLGRHPDRIKERLERSADAIGGPRLAAFYGNGRLNVGRAVGAIPQQHEGRHSAR